MLTLFVASLKKITPARDRSFAEVKPLITEDYKKAESIKLSVKQVKNSPRRSRMKNRLPILPMKTTGR